MSCNSPVEEELDGPKDALLDPLRDEEAAHDGHIGEGGQREVYRRRRVVAGSRRCRLHLLDTPAGGTVRVTSVSGQGRRGSMLLACQTQIYSATCDISTSLPSTYTYMHIRVVRPYSKCTCFRVMRCELPE